MTERLVIVGASRAGLFAAEGARRAGYAGAITMLGAEEHLPYDRPPLSKQFLHVEDDQPAPPLYRSADMLEETLGLTLRTGSRATALDVGERTVWLGDEAVWYSALVIATGTRARSLPDAGHLEGVLGLRTLDDARRLRSALDAGPRTVIIGAGLIGSEVAAAARRRGLSVTIVEPLPVPLHRVLGEQGGRASARLHERHGTTVLTGVSVTGLEGDGRVEKVVLSDGTRLTADLVVVGIGVEPEVAWLQDSGLLLDNGLVCDATLSVGVPGVYGAGDVVRWTNGASVEPIRLETWTSAAEQGRIAGQNAIAPDEAATYTTVSYMWSDQYDSRLQFVGDARADEVVCLRDDEATGGYLALYRRRDHLCGAFGINEPRLIPKLRARIARGATFDEVVALCRE